MSTSEGLSTARVEEYEIEYSSLDRMQNIVPLLFGAELMRKVVAVGANFVSIESRSYLPIAADELNSILIGTS